MKKLVSLILRNGVFLKLILNPSIKLVGSNLSSIMSLVLELLSKHIVDTVFCSSTICVLDSKKSKNIFFLCGAARTSRMTWRNPLEHQSTQSVFFQLKWPKCPYNLRLIEGQMKSKPSQNNIFHNFTSNPSFSKIFNNFDLELTLGGPKTLILIWPSELVETNAIARAIKGPKNPSN